MENASRTLSDIHTIHHACINMFYLGPQNVFEGFWDDAAGLEGLIKNRGDLDRTAVSEVMDSVKRKVKDEGLTDPAEPTIMKRVAVQGAFSRFLRNAAT
ncbi:hypothetical protein ONZ45_g18325 [Pleurotus djamor]|nr:hypothetical protein ONZ45_g18325 [Pleurotus djamor]